ncbi:MAG: YczE/YyaS/YitT family protein [bacterium]
MSKTILRIARLMTGLFLYAAGVVLTINANLGLAPWDVFNQGLSRLLGITMGQANISVGVLLVVLDSLLGERLGWGTLCNMVFIGMFMDILMLNNLLPVFPGLVPSLLLLCLGMFVVGVASYLYIGAGLGSGPRDGLMVALTKKTGRSVRFVRNAIELTVLIIGYFLGGFVGVGTLITALGIGYFVQLAFALFKFDIRQVKHRFIDEDLRRLGQAFSSGGTDS